MLDLRIKVLAIFLWACLPGLGARQFARDTDTLRGGTAALPPAGTFSVWINPQFAPGQGHFHQFFQQHDQATGNFFEVMTNPQDMLYAGWKGNGTVVNAIASPGSYVLKTNEWNHLMVTWTNGSFIKLYLNGRQIAAAASCPWVSLAGAPQTFGGVAGGVYSQSILAEYGVWSRVLNPGEMALLDRGNLPSRVPDGLFEEYDLTGASLEAQAGTGGTLIGSGAVAAADPPPPAKPLLLLSGPFTGTVGTPTSFFTVAEANLLNTTMVTPADGGSGGSFKPAAFTLTSAIPASVFTYTPARTGTASISIANDQAIADPAPLAFTALAPVVVPTLTVDATAKSASAGKDVTYLIQQKGGAARLHVFNIPGKFSLMVNGRDCGGNGAAVRHFNWRACGETADGTYKLTVHTKGMAPGRYFFVVESSGKDSSNGYGVSLTLTLQ